jgi:hypothetical protein
MSERHVQTHVPPSPAPPDTDVGQLLMVKLVQEYAEYHRTAFEARRELKSVLIPAIVFGIGGGIAFVVCGILLVIDLAVGLGPERGAASVPLGVAGMLPGLFFGSIMTAVFFGNSRELGRKIDTAERGKEGVLYRLRQAIPRLDAEGSRTLLESGLEQGITDSVGRCAVGKRRR